MTEFPCFDQEYQIDEGGVKQSNSAIDMAFSISQVPLPCLHSSVITFCHYVSKTVTSSLSQFCELAE